MRRSGVASSIDSSTKRNCFLMVASMFRHLDLSHQPRFTAILCAGPSTLQAISDTCESVSAKAGSVRIRVAVSISGNRGVLRQSLTRSRILPCSGIVGECVSAGEVVLKRSGIILLLPFRESAHVSGRGLSGGPY